MSKKNKRKFANQAAQTANAAETAAATGKIDTEKSAQPQESGVYDTSKDLRSLAIIAIFLLALLVCIYYYDQQTHVLQQLTSKLFALF